VRGAAARATHGRAPERAAAETATVGVAGCSCVFGHRCPLTLAPAGGAVHPVLIGSFHWCSQPVAVACTNPPALKLV
jgi:hypothetical protein